MKFACNLMALGMAATAWGKSFDQLVTFPKVPSQSIAHGFAARPSALNVNPRSWHDELGLHFDQFSSIKFQATKITHGSFSHADSVDIKFAIDGIPLCEFQARAHTWQDQERYYLLGEIPSELTGPIPSFWPNPEEARAVVEEALGEAGYPGNLVLTSQSKCLVSRKGELIATWNFLVKVNSREFEALASDSAIYGLWPHFFEATGHAKVFPNNNLDKELENFELPGLAETGYLANSHFYVAVSQDKPLSVSPEFDFQFAPNSSEFGQTSIFTNAVRTLAWFESQGYTDFGPSAIRLVPLTDTNNAEYRPNSPKAGLATIFIGDGDGVNLQNLVTDSDVVSHELAHHIIYKTLRPTSPSSEASVLHEGLADFFTFARTGNAKLGETVCVEGSPYCSTKAYLRTAENSFRLGGRDLPFDTHRRSQFISGMLWDLTRVGNIDRNDVVKLSLYAIDLLAPTSGYLDFVRSLLIADERLSNRQNCEVIYARAVDRGLGSLISDMSCSIGDFGNRLAPPQTSERKEKALCGAILGDSHQFSLSLWFLVPIFLPFYFRKQH